LFVFPSKITAVRKRYDQGITPSGPRFIQFRGYTRAVPDTKEMEEARVNYVGHPVNAFNLMKTWHSISYTMNELGRLNQRGMKCTDTTRSSLMLSVSMQGFMIAW
jgi:hypothetical protein